MGLFSNLERRPVTLFSSEDEGAPQLSPTAGSLKTVLKACLVEGYGSKQGLGWEMLQETATSAVFRSKDPTACGAGISIKNTGNRIAFFEGAYGTNLENRYRLFDSKYPYLASGVQTGSWRLVGHQKAVMLIVQNTRYNNFGVMMFFGDFPSIAPGDMWNFAVWIGKVSTSYDNDSGYIDGFQMFPHTLGDSVTSLYKSFDGLAVLAGGSILTLFGGERGVRYPDPITSGLMLSECYLRETVNPSDGKPLRGLWPGLYVCANDLTGKRTFDIFRGFDGTDDEYLLFFLGYNDNAKTGYFPFFVNTTAWLA